MSAGYDDDIKIYVKKSSSDISEFDRLIQNIDFNKSNGNKEKAEKLGAFFAGIKPTDECLGIDFPKSELTSAILYQARVLITFICGRITRNEVKDQFLTDTIRGSMYDSLKKNEEGYYNNIADGAAFSFYRVALKKPGEKEDIVGREFAMLCSAPKNEALIELGRVIYKNTADYVKTLIGKCEFQY